MTPDRADGEVAAAGFAPDADGGRWRYAGTLTYANASRVFAASKAMALPADGEIDLGKVGAIDSAAVAVLVALKRRAALEGKPLAFVNIPAPLVTLANLYGIEAVLAA